MHWEHRPEGCSENFEGTSFPCGSELAREGGTFSIDADRSIAIASKLCSYKIGGGH